MVVRPSGVRRSPSRVLSDHVLLVQHRAHLEHYARQADGSWVLRESSAGGAITIASLSLTLVVDSVYQGVFGLPV